MKTAVQEVFSDLEKLHPQLFNVYTTEGKFFINHFHKYLAMERKQIIDAFEAAEKDCGRDFLHGDLYYNETIKSE